MTKIGTPPEHTPFGERLTERTAPLAPDDDQYGYAHAHLAEAIAQPAIQLQEAFDPGDAASFETILDPARCPDWALPWLAQLVGITNLPTTPDHATQRQIIAELALQRRGTPAMLAAAAGLYLTGTKTVYFRERDPSGDDPAYTLEVVTLDSETPDPDKVRAALMAQKPSAIVLLYRQVQGQDWQEVVAENATWNDVVATFSTWDRLVRKEPG